jgi:conjugal transfer pilus assembly protein TraD
MPAVNEVVDRLCRPYEIASAVCLTALAVLTFAYGRLYPDTYLSVVALVMLAVAGHDYWRTINAWEFRCGLITSRSPFMPVQQVLRKQKDKPGHVYVGRGFAWDTGHAQMQNYVQSLKREDYEPPSIYMALRKALGTYTPLRPTEAPYSVHGFGREVDLYLPEADRAGHTQIFGTTGSGKTRCYEVLIAQAVAANHAVIVIDPKGDVDLRDRCYVEAKRHGREASFVYFAPSPTSAHTSVCIDPLSNFDRPSQIADRITALLPGTGTAASFKAFAWKAVNMVTESLLKVNKPVTIASLRKHIQGDLEPLAIAVFEDHFADVARRDARFRSWSNEVETIARRGLKTPTKTLDALASARAMAVATYYAEKVRHVHDSSLLTALSAAIQHDPVHYSKTIANLIPTLEQLSAGTLEMQLSPDPGDPGVVRRIRNFADLIERRSVVYVNLQALADSTIAYALASLFIADIRAVAAQRTEAKPASELSPVSLFVDECSEVMSEPLLQMLNKSRSAGFQITFATQTTSDFEMRMGSAAAAKVAFGNANTLISFRLVDPDTAEQVASAFWETVTEYPVRSSSTGTTTSEGSDFTGSVSSSQQRSEISMVSGAALRSLPNFEYFMATPGGRVFKGRMPLMGINPVERFDPRAPRDIFVSSVASSVAIHYGAAGSTNLMSLSTIEGQAPAPASAVESETPPASCGAT